MKLFNSASKKFDFCCVCFSMISFSKFNDGVLTIIPFSIMLLILLLLLFLICCCCSCSCGNCFCSCWWLFMLLLLLEFKWMRLFSDEVSVVLLLPVSACRSQTVVVRTDSITNIARWFFPPALWHNITIRKSLTKNCVCFFYFNSLRFHFCNFYYILMERMSFFTCYSN